ncbi:hypothetical protein CEXT_798801 [Caerostris extrusa]|uniref:Uncharacterized protein n=1 Tax=Caerostris extrusa TaxID=172846 RepID=A0AAV4S4R2_CAEEX|nr:hypothetical protein CEXT_798801 [Caerostris extrusa]
MAAWKLRGGTGPLNPMMMVEECKYNLSLQRAWMRTSWCVVFPHNDSVCKICQNCLKIDVANMHQLKELDENARNRRVKDYDFVTEDRK